MKTYEEYLEIIKNTDDLSKLDFVNDIDVLKLENEFDKEAEKIHNLSIQYAEGAAYHREKNNVYVQKYSTIAHELAKKGFVFEDPEILNIYSENGTGYVAEKMAIAGNIPKLDKEQKYFNSLLSSLINLNYNFTDDEILEFNNPDNNLAYRLAFKGQKFTNKDILTLEEGAKSIPHVYFNRFNNDFIDDELLNCLKDKDILKIKDENNKSVAHILSSKYKVTFDDPEILKLKDNGDNSVAHIQAEFSDLNLEKNSIEYKVISKLKNQNGNSVLGILVSNHFDTTNDLSVLQEDYKKENTLNERMIYQSVFFNMIDGQENVLQNVSLTPEILSMQAYSKMEFVNNNQGHNGRFNRSLNQGYEVRKDVSVLELLNNNYNLRNSLIEKLDSNTLENINKYVLASVIDKSDFSRDPIELFTQEARKNISLMNMNIDPTLTLGMLLYMRSFNFRDNLDSSLLSVKTGGTEILAHKVGKNADNHKDELIKELSKNIELLSAENKNTVTVAYLLIEQGITDLKFRDNIHAFSDCNDLNVLSIVANKDTKETIAHLLAKKGQIFENNDILNLKDTNGNTVQDVIKAKEKNSVPKGNINYNSIYIKFGNKHKGKTVQDVLEQDPQYLRWAHEKGIDSIVNYVSLIDINEKIDNQNKSKKEVVSSNNNNWKETVMPFGKFKGQKIGDLASQNSQYIIWAYDNVEFITKTIPDDEINKIKEQHQSKLRSKSKKPSQ